MNSKKLRNKEKDNKPKPILFHMYTGRHIAEPLMPAQRGKNLFANRNALKTTFKYSYNIYLSAGQSEIEKSEF